MSSKAILILWGIISALACFIHFVVQGKGNVEGTIVCLAVGGVGFFFLSRLLFEKKEKK